MYLSYTATRCIELVRQISLAKPYRERENGCMFMAMRVGKSRNDNWKASEELPEKVADTTKLLNWTS